MQVVLVRIQEQNQSIGRVNLAGSLRRCEDYSI